MRTKYFAFIGIGGISKTIIRFGNAIANASNNPNTPPEAPIVALGCPVITDISTCTRPAPTIQTIQKIRKRCEPIRLSISRPNIHNASILKKM